MTIAAPHLLLVEDDASLGETLKERLEKEMYQVLWTTTKRDAELSLQENDFDLVLLDIGLPDGSGFDLARAVRKHDKSSIRATPFLFMTAMNTAENRLEGYEIGAEEFIPKPFHLKELLLRVSHVLKNHTPKVVEFGQLELADRTVDMISRAIISADGKKEFLQQRDFLLLKLLLERAPEVLSRDEILDRVWGEDKFPSHRTVDNAIVRLRQALGDSGAKMIRSARGIGYQWVKA